MKRASSRERFESSVGCLINGQNQRVPLPVKEGEIFSLDLLHRTKLHHPLVSCLEPSDGRGPNNLYPFPFLFRKISEIVIIR